MHNSVPTGVCSETAPAPPEAKGLKLETGVGEGWGVCVCALNRLVRMLLGASAIIRDIRGRAEALSPHN